MIYELVDHKDPILSDVIDYFDFTNPPIDPVDLACNLAETMLHYGGIGIAANQCGLPYRVFILNTDEITPCFNPRVVDTSEEMISLEEGCLSYPGLTIKVKRPRRIKVRYTEPNGNTVTKQFDDMTARVFLHELDHLNGVCHIDKANFMNRERALKKWKKLKKS